MNVRGFVMVNDLDHIQIMWVANKFHHRTFSSTISVWKGHLNCFVKNGGFAKNIMFIVAYYYGIDVHCNSICHTDRFDRETL